MSIQPIQFRGSFAPAPKRVPTQGEIFAEQNRIQAENAKEKPKEERKIEDKVAIVVDNINKITNNIPVKHANSLNYLI